MSTKVGLLGGTFNPVHRGHVELGAQILQAFKLDEILYVLSAQPPHKMDQSVAPVDLRWRMLEVALAPHAGLVPCDIERKRRRPSWTIETVETLKRLYPKSEFYFISGSEGFLKIRTWKNHRRLLALVSFIVLLRRSEHRERVDRLLAEEGIPLCGREKPAAARNCVLFHRYSSKYLHLSSTQIRGKIGRGEDVEDLVPEGVYGMMKENKLYGC